MNDAKEAITEIDKIRDMIYEGKKWQDGEWISQAIVKLAALNSYVGDLVDIAELESNQIDGEYKIAKAAKFLDLRSDDAKRTVGEDEALALTESHALLLESAMKEYKYKALRTKRSDTQSLIDAMRSRLSYLKQDRSNVS